MREKTTPTPKAVQPLDRVAAIAVAVLAIAIAAIWIIGGNVAPHVEEFSWENEKIGADDRAFILSFSRPMDYTSVEENLRIEPPLPGKISWAGRRMAYTLDAPAPYGIDYTLQLNGARDRFADADDPTGTIDPFATSFRSRDSSFLYLGIAPGERGQLVLYNLTQQQKTVLTPPDLTVMDYEPYPGGDRVLFSAIDRGNSDALDAQLYTVTTGLRSPEDPAGKTRSVLDDRAYQNLQFDLSPDGETLIVQRAKRDNPGANFGLWIVREEEDPRPLKTQPGGEFLIAPNSSEIAIAQGQGIALVPIDSEEESSEPLAFFSEYGRIFDFTWNGSGAAMLKYNPDYTRSLFFVPNDGEPVELLETTGSVIDAQFAPDGDILYCLLSDLEEEENQYIEIPYIAAIDVETQELTRLVQFEEPQPDIRMSLSPDGLALLFDQVLTDFSQTEAVENAPRTRSGTPVSTGKLWILYPLDIDVIEKGDRLQPEELPFSGFDPLWIP